MTEEANPPELDLERARAFIEHPAARWTEAVTYPDAPHSYIVRQKFQAAGGDVQEFFWFVALAREHGRWGRWRYGPRRPYLILPPWHFWTMGAAVRATTIINRARLDEPRSVPEWVGPPRPCQGFTKAGTPCRNEAEDFGAFCWQHGGRTQRETEQLVLEWFNEPKEERDG
jgi:hypothetical protein